METRLLGFEDLDIAVQILGKGGLVAFPTETVYGLGADVYNLNSVKKVYSVKNRPSDNPLIVHFASLDMVRNLVKDDAFDTESFKLLSRFWPGALTLIVKAHDECPAYLKSAHNTIAIRMPSNEIALSLIGKFAKPLVAPSANMSGLPSSTKAKHVMKDFSGKIEAVIDGGDCKLGLESTVIDISSDKVVVMRLGSLNFEDIQDHIPDVILYDSTQSTDVVISPGLKYKHYSPEARVVLYNNLDDVNLYIENNKIEKFRILSEDEYESIDKNLFALLRSADDQMLDYIFIRVLPEIGINRAVMNRLKKASFLIL